MSALHFANFLSPVLHRTYEYIANYVGDHLGLPTRFTVGASLEEFLTGQADVAFLCGLLYVHATNQPACPVELLAAPILHGERYRGKPIYFSDVIVRRESPYASFDDLEGCSWAYNERASHSGYNLVCYSLLEGGKSPPYFGQMLKTGSHQASLQAVLDGRADATALDSHMLDVFLHHHEEVAAQIRTIAMLGPSTIPPVVVAKRLDDTLKCRIQEVLCKMHHDPLAIWRLRGGLIERFVPIADEHYQDVREMFIRVAGSMKATPTA
ncbi:MAG TPA: PhnD/SsuA/transferrin family substrate-binding protein [Ktedonobacteraceae bacterium]|nr:PhnD/SsuA/transferrin family substrate-binding protein [Ktedonobacteraceae bacterium]